MKTPLIESDRLWRSPRSVSPTQDSQLEQLFFSFLAISIESARYGQSESTRLFLSNPNDLFNDKNGETTLDHSHVVNSKWRLFKLNFEPCQLRNSQVDYLTRSESFMPHKLSWFNCHFLGFFFKFFTIA